MKNREVRLGLLTITCLLTACDSVTAPLSLDPYRAQWEAQNIEHYSYTGRLFCVFCSSSGRDVTVVVRAGSVTSATDAATGQANEEVWYTVPELFGVLEELLQDPSLRVDVAFDPLLGYPTTISVSCKDEIPDCGFSRSATGLVQIATID
ncbi:MAG TPA: DUF6174 domain-containing protein, partial [Gemmatimonadaceae bacterium]|nr:DUF6174 domain-containing protein [Gemmatimonadaceae bacterium]